MGIQMTLIGGAVSSAISAIAATVFASKLNSSQCSVKLLANGQEVISQNNNSTIIANWVNPPFMAAEWEVKASVVSGDTPSISSLDTWLSLDTDREWAFIASTPGQILQCELTFVFRKAGTVSPEITVSGTTLYCEAIDGFILS